MRGPMEGPSKNHLVWLDMEMTGLDPEACVPVQVAIVITDSNLEELDAMEVDIWQPESALESMVPIVKKMHTENGLIERIRKSEVSLQQAEQRMMSMLVRWCPYREGVLAGNSIHQDRRFLTRYFPTFEGYLHYRMIDVSSLKELVRRWYGGAASFNKAAGMHTALSDIRDSLAELRYYRQSFMKPPA